MAVIIRCDCGYEARIVVGSIEAARFVPPLRTHSVEAQDARLRIALENARHRLRCSACGRKGGHGIEPEDVSARAKEERKRKHERLEETSARELGDQMKADRRAARDSPWQPLGRGKGACGTPGIDFDY